MTPKEKALELCQKFGHTTLFAEDCNDGYTLPLRVAKLCALIAVDEIFNNNLLQPQLKRHYINGDKPNIIHLEYWQEVKQELEKL